VTRRQHTERQKISGGNTSLPPEEWRAVSGYKGIYEVSNLGRVRRVELSKGARRLPGGFIMGRHKKGGYRAFRLCDCGRDVDRNLHIMVATAFHGKRPRGKECAHIDGKPTNSRADNLAWVTPLVNSSHKFAHGTVRRGVQMPKAKLNARSVRRILRLHAGGKLVIEIAAVLAVKSITVSRVLRGFNWTHITGFPKAHLLPRKDRFNLRSDAQRKLADRRRLAGAK
jgi:hypothetical protein